MVRSLALWTKTLSFPTRNNSSVKSKDKINNNSIVLSSTPTKDKTPASTPDVSPHIYEFMVFCFFIFHYFHCSLIV